MFLPDLCCLTSFDTELNYFQGAGASTVISSPMRTDLQMSERAHFSKSKKEGKTFFAKFKASHQCYKLYWENKNFKVQSTLGRERKEDGFPGLQNKYDVLKWWEKRYVMLQCL